MDNMDFDNYVYESLYGGYDFGMYSSDFYGQSYFFYFFNGGQYYQDERFFYGLRVFFYSGGSNRNLFRMVRNLFRVMKYFVAFLNFFDDCNLIFFRIIS